MTLCRYFLLFAFIFFSCNKRENPIDITSTETFKAITIDTLLINDLSIRAILIDSNKIWYAANKGKFGNVDLNSGKLYNGQIEKDTIIPEFRSIAQTNTDIFILSVGNPALLYQISKDGKTIQLVYKERHDKVFYDSMHFMDNLQGFAMGDPIDDCFNFIKTEDGGKNWSKISCNNLPDLEKREAAFAASNSNLIIKNDKIWMVSGGKKSRVFYSSDKGRKWKTFQTPIIEGSEMTGIFTADFYDENIGIIAGGNYEKPEMNTNNKAITKNGGKTWKLIADNQAFGYASCVRFVPDSKGSAIVSVGLTGVWYSSDFGVNWKKLSDDKDLFTIQFINENTAIAAGKGKILKFNFKV